MLTKRILAMTVACGSIAMLLTACGSNSQGGTQGSSTGKAEYTLIAASTYNDNFHYVTGMKEFEKEVEEKSGGRIDVQVYGSGAIAADDRQSMEMLANNEIQFGMADMTMTATILGDERVAIACIPYYFPENLDDVYKLLDEGEAYQDLFAELRETKKVHFLGGVNAGRYVPINTKKEIDSIDDFKGLKIRVGENPYIMNPLQNMGANPTPMSWGEVYTGLQQGAIDGCFSAMEGMYDMGFYEHCKYLLNEGPFYCMHLYAYSEEFYASLPEDLQAVLDEAGDNYMEYVRKAANELSAEITELLIADGVTITEADDAFKADLIACQTDYVAERKAAYPEFIEQVEKDMKNLLG